MLSNSIILNKLLESERKINMNVKATRRDIVVLIKVEEGDNRQQYSKIANRTSSFNFDAALRKSNNKLKYALKADLPGLSVNVLTRGSFDATITSDIAIRFILHESAQKLPFKKISSNNSHVIEIEVGSNENLMETSGLFEFKAVVNTMDELYSIVEDVMLDIQMFYFFGYNLICKTLVDKKNFSILKLDFCQKQISNCTLVGRYYSLATLCKNGCTTLDYNEYVKKWKEFNDTIGIKNTKPIDDDIRGIDRIVDYIINTHPFGMQISKRKLRRRISNLKNGRYILAYLVSRPHNKKVIRNIQPLFKGSKLKRGSMIIVPYEMKTKYKKFNKYINLFVFTIE